MSLKSYLMLYLSESNLLLEDNLHFGNFILNIFLAIKRRRLNFLLHGTDRPYFLENQKNTNFTQKHFCFVLFFFSNMTFFFCVIAKQIKSENLVHLTLLNLGVTRCSCFHTHKFLYFDHEHFYFQMRSLESYHYYHFAD